MNGFSTDPTDRFSCIISIALSFVWLRFPMYASIFFSFSDQTYMALLWIFFSSSLTRSHSLVSRMKILRSLSILETRFLLPSLHIFVGRVFRKNMRLFSFPSQYEDISSSILLLRRGKISVFFFFSLFSRFSSRISFP